MRSLKFKYGIDQTGQGFYWPRSSVKRTEWLEIKRLRPVEAESVYQCNPGARQGDVFLRSDFAWYDPPIDMDLGIASPNVVKFCQQGSMLVQGWDTSLSAMSGADWTVGVTGLLIPCDEYHRGEDPDVVGQCDVHFDIYIVDVFRDKLDLGDAAGAVRAQHVKWSPETVVIEKRANGTPIMHALANSGIPMLGVDPMVSKRERVVNTRGVGSVQSWFRMHRVRFPTYARWLDAFIREIRDFTGDRGGTDDQVDAMAHMVGHAIREGGMNVRMATDWADPEKLDEIMRLGPVDNPLASLFNAPDTDVATLRDMGLAADPFSDRCGRCRNFVEAKTLCEHHRRPTTAISPACEAFDSIDGLNFINWR
jgi:predicted phage terminase large subunit-like protein